VLVTEVGLHPITSFLVGNDRCLWKNKPAYTQTIFVSIKLTRKKGLH